MGHEWLKLQTLERWLEKIRADGPQDDMTKAPTRKARHEARLARMTLFTLIALLLATSAEAQAPANCGNRADIVQRLAEKYGETLVFAGDDGHGALVEIYVSHESRTWTALVSNQSGVGCIAGAGQGFESFTPLPAVPGTDL